MKKNRTGILLLIPLLAILIFYLSIDHNEETDYVDIENISESQVSLGDIENESCLNCHQNLKGFSRYHNPEIMGCYSCHLGNAQSDDKEESHKGMVLIPGNLADAKQTCGKCHPDQLNKIENSLMTNNSGLIAVDKFVFGEADSPDYHYHIKNIKDSPSDKHIRDLCANCHLGADKDIFGEITFLSRGGGCNACHLNYSNDAKNELEIYLSSNKEILPSHHPTTDIFMNNTHCMGCHSRSSRISTNYEGWQETLLDVLDTSAISGYKIVEDKRIYKYIQEDLHHTGGMLCIDCHSSHEVMGDGNIYLHEEKAVKIQCADCHFNDKPNSIPYDSMDDESLLVFLLRDYSHTDKEILVTEKDLNPLVNTYVDSLGNAFLIGKGEGKLFDLKPQSEICSRDLAHKNINCSTCHSSWTNKCIGCHNVFDKNEKNAFDLLDREWVKGQWKEYVAEFSSTLPAMGVRENSEGIKIEPAIPGMILTIDKASYSNEYENEDLLFHRLYAPNSPHTTAKEARSCVSCHTSSSAIGYGNGELTYTIKEGKGVWTFTPEYEINSNDGLPEDAWIPFLEEISNEKTYSTRSDFRPFTLEEQKKILNVGACLQCHKENSEIMDQSLKVGMETLMNSLSEQCILPDWNN